MRKLLAVLFAVMLLASCGSQPDYDPEANVYEYEARAIEYAVPEAECEAWTVDDVAQDECPQAEPPEHLIFTTTMRIHENMPEFTFHRIVGDYAEHPWYEIPFPREVTIIIEDEDGNLIQEITGLTQSGMRLENKITFDDYNFDGYLDMHLRRWQDGAGGLLAYPYYWLWNPKVSQFVLHEQLIEIGTAGYARAVPETRQFAAWSHFADAAFEAFYEYHNGEFILVAHDEWLMWNDSETGQRHREVTRTDARTGEITVEITID